MPRTEPAVFNDAIRTHLPTNSGLARVRIVVNPINEKWIVAIHALHALRDWVSTDATSLVASRSIDKVIHVS